MMDLNSVFDGHQLGRVEMVKSTPRYGGKFSNLNNVEVLGTTKIGY